jgi:20S proteasome alpha/beta subunit
MFKWNYGTRDNQSLGAAAIVMSDRKITFGDIEYEPNQTKIAFITKNTLIAIAGDYAVHTEAVRRTYEQVQNRGAVTSHNIASIYSQAIKSIKQRQAEDLYLAPFGLNADAFLAQGREYPDRFIDHVTEQMQRYAGADVEALIVGGDGNNTHIIHVDQKGMISDQGAIGFAAIGTVKIRQRSRLFKSTYGNIRCEKSG